MGEMEGEISAAALLMHFYSFEKCISNASHLYFCSGKAKFLGTYRVERRLNGGGSISAMTALSKHIGHTYLTGNTLTLGGEKYFCHREMGGKLMILISHKCIRGNVQYFRELSV